MCHMASSFWLDPVSVGVDDDVWSRYELDRQVYTYIVKHTYGVVYTVVADSHPINKNILTKGISSGRPEKKRLLNEATFMITLLICLNLPLQFSGYLLSPLKIHGIIIIIIIELTAPVLSRCSTRRGFYIVNKSGSRIITNGPIMFYDTQL